MHTIVLNMKGGKHVTFSIDKLEVGEVSFAKFKRGDVGLILTQSESKLTEIGYCW